MSVQILTGTQIELMMAKEFEGEAEFDYESISVLIPRSREGDEGARDKLLVQMQGYLIRQASKNLDKSLQQKVSPEDIAQQALAQIIQNFHSFRGNSSAEFRGWVKTIVQNEIGKVRRQFHAGKRNIDREQNIDGMNSAAQNYLAPADGNRTPTSEAIVSEQIENFYEILELLPEHYREVIRLRSIEAKSFKEIGQAMSRTTDSVTKLFQRAVVRFADELRKNSDFNSGF